MEPGSLVLTIWHSKNTDLLFVTFTENWPTFPEWVIWDSVTQFDPNVKSGCLLTEQSDQHKVGKFLLRMIPSFYGLSACSVNKFFCYAETWLHAAPLVVSGASPVLLKSYSNFLLNSKVFKGFLSLLGQLLFLLFQKRASLNSPVLELTMYIRLASNSQRYFCLCLCLWILELKVSAAMPDFPYVSF